MRHGLDPLRLATMTLVLSSMAAAPSVSWKDFQKGLEMAREKKRAMIIFFPGEEGDPFTEAAETELFSEKGFEKMMRDLVPVRIEGDGKAEKALRKEHNVVPGTGVLVVVDVLGETMDRFSQDLDVEEVTRTVGAAIEDAEKKEPILDRLEKAYEAGEKGLKKKKFAVALKAFHLVLRIREEKGDEVPSPLYEKAAGHIDTIRAEANKLLDQAEALVEEKNFAKAKQMAKEIARRFPDEEIASRAKGIEDLVEAKLREQYGGR